MSEPISMRLLLESRYAALRPSEQKAADFILAHLGKAGQMTLAQTAQQAGVSQPTILRLIRAVGFSGFRAFQMALVEEQGRRSSHAMYGYHLSADETVASVPAHIISTTIRSLESMLKYISGEMMENCVERIRSARKIAVFGVENSIVTCRDLCTKLLYLGLPCVFYEDCYLQKIVAGSLTEHDLAIGVSYSGSSRDTVDVMETARKSGANTIVLTNFRDSRIAQYADVLLCASNEQLLYGDAIFSRTAQIAIADMLYWGVILSDYDRYAAVLDRSSQIICDKAYTP